MPAPEDTTPSPAGPASDLDIAALYARLQREVGRTRGVGPDGRAALRDLAERYWAVTAERPLERRPGLKGRLVYPVKKLLRPLLRWYVEPLAFEQRMFNEAALKLIDELSGRREHETPTLELERPPLGADERERQRAYVDDFRGAAPVLDVEHGSGELLGLLREAGIDARAVEQDDAEAHLASLADGSLGGIFLGHVAEHLPISALVRILELAARKLRSGGVLVAEAINPLSPLALRNYFADPTHSQPVVPETLALLARRAGFTSVETRFLNRPPRPEGVTDAVADILFAPLDYALVARP
jgi:hypothetical protein